MSKQKYEQRLEDFIPKTLFKHLNKINKIFIQKLAHQYLFTFQEFRQLVEVAHDLHMWGETPFDQLWNKINGTKENLSKKILLTDFRSEFSILKNEAKSYPADGLTRPKKREKGKIVLEQSEKNIFGMCPVASEKTVCCNLKTIDAVENCIFGCSYCTIQTFYRDKTVFDDSLAEKLSKIELNPNK